MPRARIITAFPESVESLADYLVERGYSVETVAPGQPPITACDLEISIDAYGREQAFQRAQQLATELGADVLVAPGVMSTQFVQPVSLPTEPHSAEVSPEEARALENELLAPDPAPKFRDTLNNWRTQAAQTTGALRSRFINTSQAVGQAARALADDWRQRAAKWAAERQHAQHLARQRAAEAASARAQELEFERAQAAQEAEARALAMEARQRELEAQRLLEQQQLRERRARETAEREMLLREQQAREAALREAHVREQRDAEAAFEARLNDHTAAVDEGAELTDDLDQEPVKTVPTSMPATPWRVAVRPPHYRSGLRAYTRNRDWRMAFVGAAVASALIIMISVEFMHRTPAKLDVQQQLPFGATTSVPNTPSLMVAPVALPSPQVPMQVATRKPKPKPAPVATAMSRPQPPQDDDLGEEVVVRHFPAANAVKARTGQDGIKRISDLE